MTNGGIHIDLISREKLAEMTPEQRIRFIVDEIKAGKVLVLERGLTAKEELELIRVTMAEIDHESFIGVETPGFSIDLKKQGLFDKILRRKPPPRMMVVGPAHLLRTIKKDGEMVQAMIVTKESMGEITMDQLPPPPKDWHAIPPPPPAEQKIEGEEGDMSEEPREEGPVQGEPGVGEGETPSDEPSEGEPSADVEGEESTMDESEAKDEGGEVEPNKEETQEEPESKEKGGEEELKEDNEDVPPEEAGDEEAAKEEETKEGGEKEEALPEEPEGGEGKKSNKSKQKKKYVSLTKYPEEPEEDATPTETKGRKSPGGVKDEKPTEEEKKEGD